MNKADFKKILQRQFIDNKSDVIKENSNESRTVSEKLRQSNFLLDVTCEEISQNENKFNFSTPGSNALLTGAGRDVSDNLKVPSDFRTSDEIEIQYSRSNKCICQKCYVEGNIGSGQYNDSLQNLWPELQDIIQRLYESKLSYPIISCFCCRAKKKSTKTGVGSDVLEQCSEIEDAEDGSDYRTCENTLRECGVRSDCGCFDLTGFPHQNLRELRSPKCVDARVIYIIEMLYKRNPHKLFQQLEKQLCVIASKIHSRLEAAMKNNDKVANPPENYIKLVLECYEKLCSASKRVSPLLMQLQRGHLARFSLTWDLLNKHHYLQSVHVKVQPHILHYVSQFRKTQGDGKIYQDLVRRYISLDEEMTLISAMWKDISTMIEEYNNDQKQSLERQMELDNRYRTLLNFRKNKKEKLHNDLKKLTKELGDLRTSESSKRCGIQNSFSESKQARKCAEKISQMDIMLEKKTKNATISSSVTGSSLSTGESCHSHAPELCISEEVIRVLNKETEGVIDGTKITASSTSRGDIVCLPGDIKKSEISKTLRNIKSNNISAMNDTDNKRQNYNPPRDLPCPYKGLGADEDVGHKNWKPNTSNSGCACCNYSVYDESPTNTPTMVNRKYNEARERLLDKLNKTKINKTNNVTSEIIQQPASLRTESLYSKEQIHRVESERDSRDSSSCFSYEDPRNVKDLLDWIEGAAPKVKDPVKKAAKKARQKLKKQQEKESICTQSDEHNHMYTTAEPSNIASDGMVNIRLLPSDIPRVAVTAVGSSPDKNKLLYTLINGQKIIPDSEIIKKEDEQKKNDKHLTIKNKNCSTNDSKRKHKFSAEKAIQSSIHSKSNSIDDKLTKDSSNKNSKQTDNFKITNTKNNQFSKLDIEVVPKCQDKFCQTDNKFDNFMIRNKSKTECKKDKPKNEENVQRTVRTETTSFLSVSENSKEKTKNKKNNTLKKSTDKNKNVNKIAMNKSSTDKSSSGLKIIKSDSSLDCIETNNKVRTKTDTVMPADINSNASSKTKKNKKKHKDNVNAVKKDISASNTLNAAFEKLQLNSDTTIEISRDISSINPSTKKVRKNSNSFSKTIPEQTIMDQLNLGIGVESLKLPPGITLTKVNAATAFVNQQRKSQQVSNGKSSAKSLADAQKSRMVIESPAQQSIAADHDNLAPRIMPVGVNGKSSRKNRRKNKSRLSNSVSELADPKVSQGKMITLRNPLFQNNSLLNLNQNNDQYPPKPEDTYDSIAMSNQASIIQNKDGMFTIRSPALQHAMSSGFTNYRPHPYAVIQDNNEHLPYSSSPPQNNASPINSGENLYKSTSLFSNIKECSKKKDINKTIPNSHSYLEISHNDTDVTNNVVQFNNYDSFKNSNTSNAKNIVNVDNDNLQLCSSSNQTLHLETSMKKVQKLNSQVTIHNISDSSIYKSPEYKDCSSVEITKMPFTQNTCGKFGNIGEHTTTCSKLNNVADQTQQTPFSNGQSFGKCKKDSELVDNIFAPNQMVNLSELESEERDIESFKRFNYYFEPPKNKPKINLNVNDIVVKKKPSNSADSAMYINLNDFISNSQ